MNMTFFKFLTYILALRAWRRFFKPQAHFIRVTEDAFLSSFRKELRSQATSSRSHHISPFVYVLKGFAMGVASMIILSSISVYANYENVAVSHALYPFKRAYEKAELILIPPPERPAYHAKLATRRFEELTTLSATHQNIQAISTASEALQEEIIEALATLPSNARALPSTPLVQRSITDSQLPTPSHSLELGTRSLSIPQTTPIPQATQEPETDSHAFSFPASPSLTSDTSHSSQLSTQTDRPMIVSDVSSSDFAFQEPPLPQPLPSPHTSLEVSVFLSSSSEPTPSPSTTSYAEQTTSHATESVCNQISSFISTELPALQKILPTDSLAFTLFREKCDGAENQN